MSDLAQLLIPAIRWDPSEGFANSSDAVDRALGLGVGGFILFGGTTDAVGSLTRHLLGSAKTPLLIMSDLERGAGQQFVGATGLPPLGAVGAADDESLTRAAARLTAREAAALGVRTVLAPVADVDVNPANPIVGTRSFGTRAKRVARHVAQWTDECQLEGAMACAKHFPGHGRTSADSHAELPVVDASEATLEAEDLMPFRAAIEAGVASIMTAHVAYPALDYTGAPATLSRRIMRNLLRDRMGFRGIVMTDAMIMSGVLGDGSEGKAGVRALDAGCDLLLYPKDIETVLASLEEGVRSKTLSLRELGRSLERRHTWAEWCATRPPATAVSDAERDAAQALCEGAVRLLRGEQPRVRGLLDVIIVDDDVGGPYPAASREPLLHALGEAEFDVRLLHVATPRAPAPPEAIESPTAYLPDLRNGFRSASTVMIFAFNDIRAWKGMPGFSSRAEILLAHAVEEAQATGREPIVVTFTHPRLADRLSARIVVNAWGGEAPTQLAFARWVSQKR